jgi:hypothetical protein
MGLAVSEGGLLIEGKANKFNAVGSHAWGSQHPSNIEIVDFSMPVRGTPNMAKACRSLSDSGFR